MRKGTWFILPGLLSLIVMVLVFSPKRSSAPSKTTTLSSLQEPILPQFLLHPGFELQVVASAPTIQQPACAAWDFQGRLWVAEKSTSLVRLAPDEKGEFKAKQHIMDVATPITGLLPTTGGMLVSARPHLWLVKVSGANGETAQKRDLSERVPEPNRPAAIGINLLAARDNWIYTAGGTYRFQPRGDQWLAEATQPRGFHDLTQDSAGHFYYSAESDPVRYDLSARETNITAKPAVFAGAQTNVSPPALVQPRSLLIYRGGALGVPAEGTAFVADSEKGLVRLIRLHRAAFSEGTFISSGYTNDCDFVQAKTPGFTPRQLTMGPDGALYIVDSGTSERRHGGAIYRVLHSSAKKEFPTLSEADLLNVDLLGHQNAWVRDAVQHSITWQNATNQAPKLKQSFRGSPNQILRLHALLALEGMSQVDVAFLKDLFDDANPSLAAEGIRLARAQLSSPARPALLNNLLKLAKQRGNFVNLQLEMFRLLALSPGPDTVPTVSELIARGVHGDAMTMAALAAARGQELSVIFQMISDPRCVGSSSHEKLMETLAMQLAQHGKSEEVTRLVGTALQKRDPPSNTAKAILTGAVKGLEQRASEKGRVTIPQEMWTTFDAADPAVRDFGQRLRMLTERR